MIVLARLVDGSIRPGMKIKVMSNNRTFEVMEVGQFTPKRTKKSELLTGEVGYLCANMREVADVKIGDTLTDAVSPTAMPFRIQGGQAAGLLRALSHRHRPI